MSTGQHAVRPSHVLLVTGARDWDAESAMRHQFRQVWRNWGPRTVTSPMLLHGACPSGADAMAQGLFRSHGFQVRAIPADWDTHGPKAGPMRNQTMVEIAAQLQAEGGVVTCVAFMGLCKKTGCPRRDDQQLMPHTPGHFSHGTVDCRARALGAGLDVLDVIHPALPPF